MHSVFHEASKVATPGMSEGLITRFMATTAQFLTSRKHQPCKPSSRYQLSSKPVLRAVSTRSSQLAVQAIRT